MQRVLISSLVIFLLSFQIINAQQPQKPSSVEIYNQIQKLDFLGSVLYIAAHPDDENTRLISYLSNETKARTDYLFCGHPFFLLEVGNLYYFLLLWLYNLS